jgi:hypothetical protein
MRMIIELVPEITLSQVIKLQKELKELQVEGVLVKYKEDNFNLELSFNSDLILSELTRIVGDSGTIMIVKGFMDDMLDKLSKNNSNPFNYMVHDLEKMGIVKKED